MDTSLLTPILEGGIRNAHFFNGRLLSAEDLRDEQDAGRKQRRQLGLGVGSGVISGLWVTEDADADGTSTTLKVSSGLALNRDGAALSLPAEARVALVAPESAAATDAGLFAPCTPPTSTAVLTGAGLYILALSPASGFEGRAPATGLSSGGLGDECRSRYAVEGVQFKLVQADALLSSDAFPDGFNQYIAQLFEDTSTTKRRHILRSLTSLFAMGLDEWYVLTKQAYTDLAAGPTYQALDGLNTLYETQALTDCDVPLALLLWDSSGVAFVDNWSVRRRAGPGHLSVGFELALPATQRSIYEARFLQFQDQLGDLLADSSIDHAELEIADYFVALPPVGLFPMGGASELDPHKFFGPLAHGRVQQLRGGQWQAVIDLALRFPPTFIGGPEEDLNDEFGAADVDEQDHTDHGEHGEYPGQTYGSPPDGSDSGREGWHVRYDDHLTLYTAPLDEDEQGDNPYGIFLSRPAADLLRVPLAILTDDGRLESSDLAETFRDVHTVYRDLYAELASRLAYFGYTIYPLEHAAFASITEVTSLAESLEVRCRARELDQTGTLEGFRALARAQKRLCECFINKVFPQYTDGQTVYWPAGTTDFPVALTTVLGRITSIAAAGGVEDGLFEVLNGDCDLAAAREIQQAIDTTLRLGAYVPYTPGGQNLRVVAAGESVVYAVAGSAGCVGWRVLAKGDEARWRVTVKAHGDGGDISAFREAAEISSHTYDQRPGGGPKAMKREDQAPAAQQRADSAGQAASPVSAEGEARPDLERLLKELYAEDATYSPAFKRQIMEMAEAQGIPTDRDEVLGEVLFTDEVSIPDGADRDLRICFRPVPEKARIKALRLSLSFTPVGWDGDVVRGPVAELRVSAGAQGDGGTAAPLPTDKAGESPAKG